MSYPKLTGFPVVTICGSMRFYAQMIEAAEQMTTGGMIVLMPFVTYNDGIKIPGDTFAQMLDDMHKAKIDLSGEIVVCTNFSGYVGESTASEIEYARRKGKAVTYR